MPNKVVLQPEVDDSLRHFGILGMKWGRRRYQNPDGSLTAEGKRRNDEVFERESEKYNRTVRPNLPTTKAMAAVTPEGKKIISDRVEFIKQEVKRNGWLNTIEHVSTYAYEDGLQIMRNGFIPKQHAMALESALNDHYIENFPQDDWEHSALSHHGILGQKWGVRRFQKEDGRRTPAGKRRDAAREDDSEDSASARQNRSRGPRSLSNDELRRTNERMQLENTYRQLTSQQIQKGNSVVRDILARSATSAATTIATAAFVGIGKKAFQSIAPDIYRQAFPKDKKNDD